MTCIAAIIEDKIWMAADSCGAQSGHTQTRKDSKLFIKNDYLIGFTSSFRMGDILKYRWDAPDASNDLDVFMRTEFIDSIILAFEKNKFIAKKEDQISGGTFLVGIKNRLFIIDSDFQVGEILENYYAVGSGRDYALGSLFSTKQLRPESRLNTAIEAAIKYTGSVLPPINILSI